MNNNLTTRISKCTFCNHFIFKDPDINYCSNCGKNLEKEEKEPEADAIIIKNEDVQPAGWFTTVLRWFW